MKTILVTVFSIFSFLTFGQNLNCESLKSMIGERVYDFENFYNVTSTKVDDNFGDLTVHYQNVEVDGFQVNIVLSTEGKNIKNIAVSNSEQRTSFFKKMGLDIEKATPEKKNFKTLYISLAKNNSNKKTYYDSINDLIEILRQPTTDLSQNHGLIESHPLDIVLLINKDESILTVK